MHNTTWQKYVGLCELLGFTEKCLIFKKNSLNYTITSVYCLTMHSSSTLIFGVINGSGFISWVNTFSSKLTVMITLTCGYYQIVRFPSVFVVYNDKSVADADLFLTRSFLALIAVQGNVRVPFSLRKMKKKIFLVSTSSWLPRRRVRSAPELMILLARQRTTIARKAAETETILCWCTVFNKHAASFWHKLHRDDIAWVSVTVDTVEKSPEMILFESMVLWTLWKRVQWELEKDLSWAQKLLQWKSYQLEWQYCVCQWAVCWLSIYLSKKSRLGRRKCWGTTRAHYYSITVVNGLWHSYSVTLCLFKKKEHPSSCRTPKTSNSAIANKRCISCVHNILGASTSK